VDADEEGNNVFFATRARLTGQDEGDNVVLYDARVNGFKALTPPECTGTGCQGVPPAPPIFATPSSVTFNGVGNYAPAAPSKAKLETKSEKLTKALRACLRDKHKKKRLACEKSARKKYGPAKKAGKARKSTTAATDRRAS
jgi:hypothetical protein